jgi:DNA-binding NarL/FixJ family response regulator
VGALTPREVEVLGLFAKGMSTRDAASALEISPLTIQSHVKNILVKLGVHTKLEAVVLMLRNGVIRPEAGSGPRADGKVRAQGPS